MAPISTALTTRPESGTPYQLDSKQVSRAVTALTKHISSELQTKQSQAEKKNLLAEEGSEDEVQVSETPVWLIVSTKQHIVDDAKLKPGKIALPHALNQSPDTKICLITVAPQRAYKDLIAHPTFSAELSSKIARVIDIKKLSKKYKSYEARRQLIGEYDMFLADDRIVTMLPKTLGKAFYRGGAKRPVPVSLIGKQKFAKDENKQRIKEVGIPQEKLIGEPALVAKEISRAISSALVHLSASTTTAVKVAYASWAPEKIVQNINAVVAGLVRKFISKGWRNLRSLHIKGPDTMALPVWLAEELWVEEDQVLDQPFQPPIKDKEKRGRKRKTPEDTPKEGDELTVKRAKTDREESSKKREEPEGKSAKKSRKLKREEEEELEEKSLKKSRKSVEDGTKELEPATIEKGGKPKVDEKEPAKMSKTAEKKALMKSRKEEGKALRKVKKAELRRPSA
ncbi:ribosomal protein L1 [Patellaria atrata CBS 101060]|uniref:Ribosomal protein L1 n=1 Tax=Patellaria atrata CBS 101060 TaxID=1346257 RepID=A0A9P4VMZ9_9PEZI|nr:ribosomal protein L1 [Patellaria atrata CBS 101060]